MRFRDSPQDYLEHQSPWLATIPGPLFVLWVIILTGCTTSGTPGQQAAEGYTHFAAGSVKIPVAAAFGPDRRLWRVVSTDDHVFVDYSKDHGKTFSTPVVVNPERVPIRARSEYRSQIAVDSANRVYVVYPAFGLQPWTTYLSVSEDGGQHFSPPEPLSDQAKVANSFEAVATLDPEDRLYLFWHDERESASEESGNAIYYSIRDATGKWIQFNRKVAEGVCSCCRLAADLDRGGQAVLVFRNIYPGNIRDHELARAGADGETWTKARLFKDNWQIEACPTHGPALEIGADGRYHVAWFTQGRARQGLFYAYSSDGGRDFSEPMAIANGLEGLPSHPDVISLEQRVVIAWSEFDGSGSRILARQSADSGATWSQPRVLAKSSSESDYPFLLSDGRTIFLSWNTQSEGYRLIAIEKN
ncbi:MAG: sialidase family protein [Gammaproteobacteria bacterium]